MQWARVTSAGFYTVQFAMLCQQITATRIRESVLSFVRNLQNISTFHGTETDHFGANFGNAKMCLRTEIRYEDAVNYLDGNSFLAFQLRVKNSTFTLDSNSLF